MPPLFHVVLHQPKIPNNTGAIGRACVAMGCSLTLVRPLGFEVTEKALRRAGLDYWPRLAPRICDTLDEALEAAAPGRVWLLSARARRPVWEADLRLADALVFGCETRGLPERVLDAHPDRVVGLPLLEGERSLNLACAAVAVMQEGLRQCVVRGEIPIDEAGRFALRGG